MGEGKMDPTVKNNASLWKPLNSPVLIDKNGKEIISQVIEKLWQYIQKVGNLGKNPQIKMKDSWN